MSDSVPPALTYFVEMAGQRFGPAGLDLLRQWVQEGRISPDSILIEESSQRRLTAREVPGLFEPGQVSPPPAAGMSAPTPGYAPAKKPFPVWAILLIVAAGLCVLCVPIGGAILFPVFSQARLAAKRSLALSNIKQLGIATLMYANDYDERFPLHMATAMDAEPMLLPYSRMETIFVSTNPAGGTILGNSRLAGQNADKVLDPANTVVFYDEKPWDERGMACYVDGHAKLTTSFDEIVSSLQKDPIDHSEDKAGSSK